VIALLTGVAFVAGLIDAIAGGGGLLTLPALLAAGLGPHLALGTSKGQAVFGSGSALFAFARLGAVDLPLSRLTFPLGLLGSLIGAAAALALSPQTLRPVIVGLLPLAAATLLLRRPRHAAPRAPAGPRAQRLAGLVALVLGAYDGFFGPGTGTLLILAFVLLRASPLVRATADAKVVNFASNLAAVGLFAWRRAIDWSLALPMAAAQLTGGQLGARLALRGGERLVRASVLLVTTALTIKLALDLVLG